MIKQISLGFVKSISLINFQELNSKPQCTNRVYPFIFLGVVQTMSLGGARYFLSLIDDYSRMMWVCVEEKMVSVLRVQNLENTY